jgi:hypothetical protein
MGPAAPGGCRQCGEAPWVVRAVRDPVTSMIATRAESRYHAGGIAAGMHCTLCYRILVGVRNVATALLC